MAKAPLSDETWAEIEALWRAGESNSKIARDFNITRQAIIDRSNRKGWTRDLSAPVSQEALSQLHGVNAHTEEGRRKVIELVGAARAAVIRSHQSQWSDVYALKEDAYRILKGLKPRIIKGGYETKEIDGKDVEVDDKGKPVTVHSRVRLARSIIDLMGSTVTALINAQEGERRSHGFDYKTQAEGETEDENARRERLEKIDETIALIKASDIKVIEGEVIDREVVS